MKRLNKRTIPLPIVNKTLEPLVLFLVILLRHLHKSCRKLQEEYYRKLSSSGKTDPTNTRF